MSIYRWKVSTTPGEYNWSAAALGDVLADYTLTSGIVWPAEADVNSTDVAWGPTGAEYAGALNMGLYQLKTSSVLIAAIPATIIKNLEIITATSGETHVDGTYDPMAAAGTATYYVDTLNGYRPWSANNSINEGDIRHPVAPGNAVAYAYVYVALGNGMTGETEPNWDYSSPGGSQTSDNGIYWLCVEPTTLAHALASLQYMMEHPLAAGDVIEVNATVDTTILIRASGYNLTTALSDSFDAGQADQLADDADFLALNVAEMTTTNTDIQTRFNYGAVDVTGTAIEGSGGIYMTRPIQVGM